MDGSPGRRIPPAAAAAMIFILTFAADRAAVAQDATLRGGADLDARALAIHRHVLTLDSHVDVIVPGAQSEYGPGQVNQASADELRRGGMDAVAFAIAVSPGPRTAEGIAAARAEADAKLAVRARLRSSKVS